MVFRQGAQPRQLPKADRLGQLLVDVLHQLPALVRRQAALESQPLTQADLAEQGMVEHFKGQAAGQQAFCRFLPIEADQLMKTSRLRFVFQKGAFAQLQGAGFTVQQGDATQGKLLGAEVHMGQADFTIDHPGRLMLGGQDAQLVGAALGAGLVAPESAGAAGHIARQGVMAGRLVILGVVVVAPQSCRQAVPKLGRQLQASVGRAVQGFEDLQVFQCRHGVLSDALHPTPGGWRCDPSARQKRKNLQVPSSKAG